MSYETILFFHIGAFILNISLVVLADIVGLFWVLGKIQKLPKNFMLAAHYLIWLGLAVSITSGSLMFWDLREYLLTIPAFYTKVFFVSALVINSVFISRHLRTALNVGSFSALLPKERRAFWASGVVSTVSWISVVIAALMLGL